MKTYIVTIRGIATFTCLAKHSIDAIVHAMIKYGCDKQISARPKK